MTTVEILYFQGCPNARPAVDLVRSIVEVDAPDAVIEETQVNDTEAQRFRFLGSPTVRVDGRDVEPGADERMGYGMSCRRYETRAGIIGVPLDDWIRVALQEANGPTAWLGGSRTCGCSPTCWCRTGWKRRIRWFWPARHVPM